MSDQIKTKEDGKGIFHSMDLLNHKVYALYTKAWERRWWKAYSDEKAFVLLSGRCRVTLELDGNDESLEILPGELIHIEPGIPHVFYFPEDSELLEWFGKDAQHVNSDRLTEMKKWPPLEVEEEFFDDED